jgi:primase-polymerase (primpol)-like protein
MKVFVILVVLISATAHAAIFDSIDSVDVLKQKAETASAKTSKNANRTPAGDVKSEAGPSQGESTDSDSSER